METKTRLWWNLVIHTWSRLLLKPLGPAQAQLVGEHDQSKQWMQKLMWKAIVKLGWSQNELG